MAAVLPLLSVDGFVNNKNDLMSKLYEHFKASDESQSDFYMGEVVSLKYILHQYVEPSDIKKAVEDALSKIYSNYFETVDPYVVVDVTDNGIALSIDVSCVDNTGVQYTLARANDIVKKV